MSNLRVFIAIELPKTIQNVLLDQQAMLKKQLAQSDGIRWVKAENSHLTLKFLGDVPSKQLGQIKSATQTVIQGQTSFQLQVAGLGCFPNTTRPKVIWAGIDGAHDKLIALRDSVEQAIAPLGYPTEARPFNPHLTLGRVKTQDRAIQTKIGQVVKTAPSKTLAEWTCEQVNVMQSDLTPQGAIYKPLAQYALA